MQLPGVVDAEGNQGNDLAEGVGAASPLPPAQWEITKPPITVGELTDTYYNNEAFIAGGTLNAGGDEKAGQVVFKDRKH